MVTVKRDERTWLVKIICPKAECPYLYFPNSMEACTHPGMTDQWPYEDVECTYEKCPCKTGEAHHGSQ